MERADDLESFRLPSGEIPPPKRDNRRGRGGGRQHGAFIRGPIFLAWLDGVLNLPGRMPLVVALALVYQSGLERSNTIRVTNKLRGRFNVSLRTCHDVLAKMEAAGLVTVAKRPGRCREVTILKPGGLARNATCSK